MSIKITVSNLVTFKVAGVDVTETGASEAFDFRVTARRLTSSEFVAAMERADRNVQQFVQEIVVGWDGVVDDEGKPVPFSADAFGQLLERRMRLAPMILRVYSDEAGGREKN
ncbi:MAG: Phage tail assembly chaperone [Pseudomonadota bacterium]|jgi:hypothetical protein